jgi:hypothetical protein
MQADRRYQADDDDAADECFEDSAATAHVTIPSSAGSAQQLFSASLTQGTDQTM